MLLGQPAQARYDLSVFAVDNRRAQPFEQDGVGTAQQLQGLAQIPAVDVKVAIDRHLDHITARIDAQVPRQPMDVDEAHVVVAVG